MYVHGFDLLLHFPPFQPPPSGLYVHPHSLPRCASDVSHCVASQVDSVQNSTSEPPVFFSSRTFSWTPHCEQAGTYRVLFSGINKDGKSTKAVQFKVMPPSPEIVTFENATITTRVGCKISISIDTREADPVLRALDNPNYGQTITVSFTRTEPRGIVVKLSRLQGAEFQVLPEKNQWSGVSARLEWVASRGQEAFNYTVRWMSG